MQRLIYWHLRTFILQDWHLLSNNILMTSNKSIKVEFMTVHVYAYITHRIYFLILCNYGADPEARYKIIVLKKKTFFYILNY